MFTFDYNGNTLQLPNPDLGDNRRVGHNDVVTSNQTGELLNIPDGQVVKDTLSMSFSKLREAKRDEAETYFKTYQAQEFTITDHDARVYTAVLTNTDLEFITIKDGCFYTLNLELMEI